MSTQEADRDLLELAAKAAGVEVHPHLGLGAWVGGMSGNKYFSQWNPLADDGDALRLMTKLPFRELYVSEIGATVSWRRADGSGHGFKCDEYANEHGGDLNAATRRAIVRAAAKIGRAMP